MPSIHSSVHRCIHVYLFSYPSMHPPFNYPFVVVVVVIILSLLLLISLLLSLLYFIVINIILIIVIIVIAQNASLLLFSEAAELNSSGQLTFPHWNKYEVSSAHLPSCAGANRATAPMSVTSHGAIFRVAL